MASMADEATEQPRPEPALRWLGRKLWAWPVIGTVAFVIWAAGLNPLYAGEYLFASVLFFVAVVLAAAKAVSWEEAKAHPEKNLIRIGIIIMGTVVFGGSEAWVGHQYRADHPKRSAMNTQLPHQRFISPADQKTLKDCLSKQPGHVAINATSNDHEALHLAKDWLAVFTKANWDVYNHGIGQISDLGPQRGTWIHIHAITDSSGIVGYMNGSAEQQWSGCLSPDDLPTTSGGYLIQDKDEPPGHLTVNIVGSEPTQP